MYVSGKDVAGGLNVRNNEGQFTPKNGIRRHVQVS